VKEGHDDTTFYNKIIDTVIVSIESYINLIAPTELVFIAFDGVAPLAKMEQQRNRRNKTAYMSKISFEPGVGKGTGETETPKFSTSMITPGTQFMRLLSTRISRHFANLDVYGQSKMKIVVTGPDECGEGEHKMFMHMRANKAADKTVAVYGLDSDLIMLSIFHCAYFRNIYIFREAPEFMKSQIPIKPTSENEPYFMNIRKLSESIEREMKCTQYADGSRHTRIYDYIFLCFLLGNDFLPHYPALNIRSRGVDVLMDTYRNTIGKYPSRGFISKDMKILWKWVATFIQELAKIEHELLIQEYSAREKMEKWQFPEKTAKDREQAFQNIPILYRANERYICPTEKFWESRYYSGLFRQSYCHELVEEVCANYLEGLEWVFRYYTDACPDWKWKYHYHFPPLLVDLAKRVPTVDRQFIPPNTNGAFRPATQLAYVLPKESFDLMSLRNRAYLQETAGELYCDKPDFEWAFCRYFWESHAILPEIPRDLLEKWEVELEE